MCVDLQANLDSLLGSDFYLTIQDIPLYLDAHAEIDATWKRQDEWLRKSILNTICTHFFSYTDQIWNIRPCEVETTENRSY
eukprot:gene16971-20192_t